MTRHLDTLAALTGISIGLPVTLLILLLKVEANGIGLGFTPNIRDPC